jgi:hypothetical protein
MKRGVGEKRGYHGLGNLNMTNKKNKQLTLSRR